MDTFVIKGRTRIPSNKPQPADLRIAEALLDSNPAIPRRNLPINMALKEHNEDANSDFVFNCIGIEDNDTPRTSQETTTPTHRRQKSKPQSAHDETESLDTLETHATAPLLDDHSLQTASRSAIIIPNRRRSRRVGDNPPPKRAVPIPPLRKNAPPRNQEGIYDGAIGSSYESRTTSMTWSTVSHRIFSETSADAFGLGASDNLDEFNRLAVQHGLPELEDCPVGELNFE